MRVQRVAITMLLAATAFAQTKTAPAESETFRRSATPLSIVRVPLDAELLNDEFKIAGRLSEIPPIFKDVLPLLHKTESLTFAGPGAPFHESDVLTASTKGLPWRRIDLIGISARSCFVMYQNGGWANGNYLVVINPCSGPAANVAWSLVEHGCDSMECVRQLPAKARSCTQKLGCD